MRKTILLNFEYKPVDKPRKFKVLSETETTIEVDGGRIIGVNILTKQDGGYVNNYGVRYVEIKADRRPKPFSVQCHVPYEYPRNSVRRFATLLEAAQYVWERYQGVEYFDGPAGFHTDYAAFTLHGFTLADVYEIDYPNYEAKRKTLEAPCA